MMFATLTTAEINGAEFKVVAQLHETQVRGAIACGDGVKAGDVYSGGGFLNRAAVERGRPQRTLAAAQAELVARVEDIAERLRQRVASGASASKLAVYREKYATAVAALADDAAALAALEPEATARGETPAELAALVKSLGDQWRAAGLAIDAAYQAHKAAIAQLSDLAAADAYDTGAGWP